MHPFLALIAKEKKSEIEELFSDTSIESGMVEEFLRRDGEKISLVKSIINDWVAKKPHAGIFDKIKQMLELNKALRKLILAMLNMELKEKKLFYFIIKEKMHQLDRRFAVYKRQKDLLDEKKYEEYEKELKPNFEQLFDALMTLARLLYLQTVQINKHIRTDPDLLAKDLVERHYLFRLIMDEADLDRRIRKNTISIVRIVNEFLGYEKRDSIRTEKRGEREVITGGITFEEINDRRSINFERFYLPYKDSFVPDEREPKSDLKRYIDYAGLKLIARNGTINHLIIARIGGNVIGMNFFGTYFLKKKGIFFGVGWWTVIAEQFRGKGVAPQLHNYRLKIMQRDSMLFGARRLDAIFIEVNDPSRVTSQLIAEDTESAINPFERMDFMMRGGVQAA